MRGIGVLGPVRLIGDDGLSIALRSRRQALLLAILASSLGSVVSADELVEGLWPDELPDHPIAALQSQVFRLRRQLAAVDIDLRTDGTGYTLEALREQVDAARFEDLVAEAEKRGSTAEAVNLLDEALGLWRGRAYLEVADHQAVMAEAARLEELRTEAAETRAELLLQLGNSTEAARSMERLARDHPFREGPVAIQMRALAQQGRHADALSILQAFRRTLGEELGLEASPALHELEGEILRHEQPVRPRIGLPGNSLVGRQLELADVVSRLSTSRLVTLTGPGGVGKTRLAVHAAARVEDRYPDGVALCELANITTDDRVAPAVASALKLERDAKYGDAERVVQFLQPRRALLVLDNCEHVASGAAALISAVLSRAPDVDILATSRRRLGIEGEHLLPVSGLAVTDGGGDDSPATVLFVDRVKAIRPDFVLTGENRAAVSSLCRLLAGLPLALELAAARTASRTPMEILDEFADRLSQLADPYRSRERHRSIDAAIGWSYDRLSPLEQHVFRHVAVFAGGFTAEAVSTVADTDLHPVVDALSALVEHSMLAVNEMSGRARFSILEPIRQFAEARLEDDHGRGPARSRHASWAAGWIERADAGLRGAEETRWARAVAAEIPNLRAAHQWARDHEANTAMRIAGAMYWYAFWYGASEAFDWATALATVGTDSPGPLLAGPCATAALGACRRGDVAAARELAERGITCAGADAPAARFAWEALSSAEMITGNYESALRYHEKALDLARLAGDTVQQSREHAARALALGYLRRLEPAAGELSTGTSLAARARNPTMQGFCEYVRGEIYMESDPSGALPRFERARDLGHLLENRYLAAIAGVSAVSCAARMDDPIRVVSAYAELLDHFERAGSRAQQWTTIRTLIEALTRIGRDEHAAVLFGALVSSPTALPVIGADADRIENAVSILKTRLGEERFERMKAKGAALGDAGAIVYAAEYAEEAARSAQPRGPD